jgi:hypothetical protein
VPPRHSRNSLLRISARSRLDTRRARGLGAQKHPDTGWRLVGARAVPCRLTRQAARAILKETEGRGQRAAFAPVSRGRGRLSQARGAGMQGSTGWRGGAGRFRRGPVGVAWHQPPETSVRCTGICLLSAAAPPSWASPLLLLLLPSLCRTRLQFFL